MAAARIIAGAGHRPGGLGRLWRPIQWMPGVAFLRDRLERELAGGPIEVVANLEPGFGLMLGCAALMLRNEGRSVRLVAAVPYAAQVLPYVKYEGIARWYHAMLMKADDRKFLFDGQAFDAAHGEGLQDACGRWMVDRADDVLVCWSGSKGSSTGRVVAHAAAVGKPCENVYQEVMAALHPARAKAG